jgi:hypothetical protein
MEYKVFSLEFDGMVKCGKDTVMKQVFSYEPNTYITNARGLLSQIAYAKLFNRDAEYKVEKGYLDNTLFVLLTVDEDDWNVRCDLTHEHQLNALRSDVEAPITWKSSNDAFEYAYDYLKSIYNDDRHFMKFNTSHTTPINIIKAVIDRMKELNNIK